jgi:glycosyltransferase involved in cell wall biosynthesis
MKKHKAIIIYHRYFDDYGVSRQIGGVQTYLYELSSLLIKKNYEVVIIQASKKQFMVEEEETKIVGVKLPKILFRFMFLLKRILFKRAKQEITSSDDIVIFASDHFSVRTKHDKTVVIQHGIDWDLPARFMGRFSSKSNIIAHLTKYLKSRSALRGMSYPKWKVCVDHNFVNWARTKNVNNDFGNLRVITNFVNGIQEEKLEEKLEEKQTTIKIIFARRMFEYRGALLMKDVVSKIIKNYNFEVKYTFAGSGPELEHLKKAFVKNKNVNFLTYESHESLSLHSKYDIAVVPSIGSEGTSLSVAEAMASGCAVVASNVGGMTNMIIDNWNGLLISPDTKSLEYALVTLIKDSLLRAKLSTNGKAIAADAFSLARWQNNWNALVDDIAKDGISCL